MAAGQSDAVENQAEVLEVQGLGLNEKGAPRGAQFMSEMARAGSPIIAVPAMPVVPAADSAWTVIGPDDPAVARIIVGIVAAVEMTAMEVRKAIAAEAMEAPMAEAATVPTATMPTTAAMEGVEAATMPTTAMETTTVESTSAVAAATMAATADLYQAIGCSFRR